jgi:predicted phage tail protein
VGLGKRIKPFIVDKWELYRIAQYCDQLVPNGLGGQEPRFLCDMNLPGKADAWSLLRDISAIYRSVTYWAQGQLVMQADSFYDMNTWDLDANTERTRQRWRKNIQEALSDIVAEALMCAEVILQGEGV